MTDLHVLPGKKVKNRFGLPRYIPEAVRRKIRAEAGYGCVLCGSIFIEYEHIEPEFKDAERHDPEKMTALCAGCHDRVTKRIISKKRVWAAKLDPKAKRDGCLKERLFCETRDRKVQVGGLTFGFNNIGLAISGLPVFWIESPQDADEPPNLCCVFYDKNGKKVAFINRNEFYSSAPGIEISTSASRIVLRCGGETFLEMDVAGDGPLKVKRIANNVGGIPFEWDESKRPGLRFGSSCIGGVTGELAFKGGGTAITMGYPMRLVMPGYTPQELAKRVKTEGAPLRNFQGELLGWHVGQQVVDINFLTAGCVKGSRAYSLLNEYAGEIQGEYIVHDEPSFEDGEPIFIDGSQPIAPALEAGRGYDTSYKVFGLPPRYCRGGFSMAG